MPAETQEVLDYDALIAVLRLLEGEEACIAIKLGEGGHGSRLAIRGTLSIYDYNWAAGVAVGDARLLLSPHDQLGATLSTFDGNDHFQIAISFAETTVVIGDTSSLASDEFE